MISIAEKSDKENLIKLWREAFEEESYAVRFYETVSFEDILVWRENEKVVSMMHVLPCFYTYDSRTYCGVYLYALATAGEYRKKGIMEKLIHAAKKRAEEKNLDFLCLIAANQALKGYYNKFGFCAVLKETKENAVLHFHKDMEEYVRWECMQERKAANTNDKTEPAEFQMICRLKEQPDCVFTGKIPY